MADGFTRRELLAFLPTGWILYWLLTRQDKPVGAVTVTDSGIRTEQVRPLAGGVGLSDTDVLRGTLGCCVEYNGTEAVITNRHVLDGSFCGGSSGDLVGKAVFQPREGGSSGRIGTITAAGDTGGVSSDDWAVIELDDSSQFTDEIVGIGSVGSSTTPTVGERAVMSGLRSGIVGCEIEETGISRKFRGCQFNDLIRYRVDGYADLDGNSGAVVGHIESGELRPIGLHSFSGDAGAYAVPITQLTQAGVTFTSSSTEPTVPDRVSRIEGTILGYDGTNAEVHLGNVGGETGTRVIEIRRTDSNTVSSTSVTLDPLDTTTVSLAAPESCVLDTGDAIRLIDL